MIERLKIVVLNDMFSLLNERYFLAVISSSSKLAYWRKNFSKVVKTTMFIVLHKK